jgi:hypothetical protein
VIELPVVLRLEEVFEVRNGFSPPSCSPDDAEIGLNSSGDYSGDLYSFASEGQKVCLFPAAERLDLEAVGTGPEVGGRLLFEEEAAIAILTFLDAYDFVDGLPRRGRCETLYIGALTDQWIAFPLIL